MLFRRPPERGGRAASVKMRNTRANLEPPLLDKKKQKKLFSFFPWAIAHKRHS
jgi:hypothetical protein